MATLHSSSARNAAKRGCSAVWETLGGGGKSAQTTVSSIGAASEPTLQQPPWYAPTMAPLASKESLATVIPSHTALLPRAMRRLVRDEPTAVRAAESRIACYTHVGPHFGPGSGSGVNFCISRMKGQLERLDTWKDGKDTTDDGEDDDEEDGVRTYQLPNRLMTFGSYD